MATKSKTTTPDINFQQLNGLVSAWKQMTDPGVVGNMMHTPQGQLQVSMFSRELASQLSQLTGKSVDPSQEGIEKALNSPPRTDVMDQFEGTGIDVSQGTSVGQMLSTVSQYGNITSASLDQLGGRPAPAAATKKTDPTSTQFNLYSAMQPYLQPYENMMDVALGSKPGQAPTVAQAEQAGMAQLGPYLKGLPSGLAQTVLSTSKPMFAALGGLPAATNASAQTAAGSGLLTDLINAAKEQTMYGLGIGQATQPGALGALQTDVQNAGSGLLPQASTGTSTTPAQSITSNTQVPGG